MTVSVSNTILIILLFITDGILRIWGTQHMLTRFFGFAAKPKKGRHIVFSIVLAVYVLLNVTGSFILSDENNTITLFSEVIFIFNLIYWAINLEERKKGKKALLFIVTDLMVSLFSELVAYIVRLPFNSIHGDKVPVMLFAVVISNIISFGLILGISALSSKKRKTPMPTSLIWVCLLTYILIEVVMSVFTMSDIQGEYIHPMVTLRLIVPEEMIDSIIGYALVIMLALFAGIIVFLLIKESESQYFQKKNTINEYYLESQKQHYESLSESNREIRKIKHDMKNHIYCLSDLYESSKYDELGEYLKSMGAAMQHTELTTFVGHEIADAIISEKKSKAEALGITLKAEGALYGVEIAAIDVCTIFSNIMDNAIEATQKLPEDKRQIVLNVGRNKNYLFISEYNPVDKVPDINDNVITTTKKDSTNHGFGITNIKEAAAKYDGDVQLFVEGAESDNKAKESGSDKLFHIEVLIPIQE